MRVLGTNESLDWTLGMVLDISDTLPFFGLKALSLVDFTKVPFGTWTLGSDKPGSNPVFFTLGTSFNLSELYFPYWLNRDESACIPKF